EQPRGDDAAAPPDLGDVREVEVVLEMFRLAQRRGLGVVGAPLPPGTGVLQDVEPLGVSGHQAVLDSVVDHLHEVTGAGGPAVDIAGLAGPRPPRGGARPRPGPTTGRQRLENRTEMTAPPLRPADHQAVAALEAPHTAAGADVDVIDARCRKRRRARDIV